MRGSGGQFGSARDRSARAGSEQITTKARGDRAEALARRFLQRQGLRWLQSNFRTPGRGGGEIDLIMQEADGTLVFVEVRQRSGRDFGGAGASISSIKRQRIVLAARHYLLGLSNLPPCRFDAVLVDGAPDAQAEVRWLKAAFDAS